jgi:sec-independent protein translocase protein TatC
MVTPDGQDGLGGAARARMPLRPRGGNPDGRMPLIDHIRELRNRVFKALLAVIVGSIIGWYTFKYVWNFIEAPYCRLNLPVPLGVQATLPVGSHVSHHVACTLYFNGLFDALFLHLKIAIATGVILSSPVWLYQLWAFLAPGLYSRERRWAYFFAGAAIPLFAVGATIAYFAMTKGLHFLLLLAPHNAVPLITISTYLSYAMAMLLIFGVAFELPLFFILMNVAGVLTHERFKKWRRMIIFAVFAFAAVATPSPDPISMLLLAVPCVALVEMAQVFAWVHDRRKARRQGPYPGLSPEALAELDSDSRDGADIGG